MEQTQQVRNEATTLILQNFINKVGDVILPQEFALEVAPEAAEDGSNIFRISLIFNSKETAESLQELIEEGYEPVMEADDE